MALEENHQNVLDLKTSLVMTYICLFFLVILLAFLGNILFCITVCRSENMRAATDTYLCCIACANVVSSLSAVFNEDNILGDWKTGQFICKTSYFIIYVSYGVVSFTLLILYLDEYLKVNHPKFYQCRKISKQWKKAVVLILIVTSLCNIPKFLDHEVLIIENLTNKQQRLCVLNSNMMCARQLYVWFMMIVVNSLPFLLMVVFNIVICRKFNHTSQNVASSGGNVILLQKRKKLIRLFSVHFILHFLLGWPQIIFQFFLDLDIFSVQISQDVWLVFRFIYFSRYFLYTVVYMTLYKPFLRDVKKLANACCQ